MKKRSLVLRALTLLEELRNKGGVACAIVHARSFYCAVTVTACDCVAPLANVAVIVIV
jgi:hypothetical protein